ncbi:MAG: hypothetical protein UX09_C0005G0016 [Candidatus Uhrbacteria bacterium GW2011_GWE2_45_35]|uniref:Homeodomain phBC6A51-type domain-containing protein n=1 Tax=Candidatus Uhrbacteria bacterium GW2011_GWE2_45_35 TaxID=1618993 RepID=A0A0G1QK60_9BACT|nr:MAG: hypothetical protein UX09_C0005G0016 [Candidatus Uhrbacteria bacterium GW2011_GWE2_45_35]
MKKNNETKMLFLEQLKKTPIVQIACEKLCIGRATFYRWKEEDAEFSRKVDIAIFDGRLMVNDLAESQLIGAVRDRDMRAIMYWLKHHHTDYKTRIELEGTLNTVHELSDEQKELVRQAFVLAGITNEYEEDNNENTNQ